MQAEHQEHLGRPAPDSFDLRQRRDDVIIRHPFERVEPEAAVGHLLTQVSQVADLLAAEANRAQPAVRQGYEVGRGKNGTIGKKRKESLENSGGGLCRELLPRNRLDEGGERIRALIPGETARTMLFA